MSWALVAAAAAPYVIGALQKKPKMPGAPAPVVLPNRDEYIDMVLQSGFNTNSDVYVQASEQVQDQVNRALAKQGLVGSSMGATASIAAQNKVAQAMIDEKLRRQQEAIQLVNNYDLQRASVAQGDAQAAYNHAMAQYQEQVRRQAAVAQGVGAIAGAGANVYAANQAQTTWDRRRAEDRAWMSSMYGQPVVPQMTPVAPVAPGYIGTPGFNYNSPYYGQVG